MLQKIIVIWLTSLFFCGCDFPLLESERSQHVTNDPGWVPVVYQPSASANVRNVFPGWSGNVDGALVTVQAPLISGETISQVRLQIQGRPNKGRVILTLHTSKLGQTERIQYWDFDAHGPWAYYTADLALPFAARAGEVLWIEAALLDANTYISGFEYRH